MVGSETFMMNVIERAHALSEHVTAMTKHAGGYGPVPEPDTEHARAIVVAYHQLLEENEELRAIRGAYYELVLDHARLEQMLDTRSQAA